MTQTIDSAKDVVEFLKAQHEQIKSGFAQVAAAHGEQRSEAFDQLRRLLAVHETAEEEIVHPRAKSEIADGDKIVSGSIECTSTEDGMSCWDFVYGGSFDISREGYHLQ